MKSRIRIPTLYMTKDRQTWVKLGKKTYEHIKSMFTVKSYVDKVPLIFVTNNLYLEAKFAGFCHIVRDNKVSANIHKKTGNDGVGKGTGLCRFICPASFY